MSSRRGPGPNGGTFELREYKVGKAYGASLSYIWPGGSGAMLGQVVKEGAVYTVTLWRHADGDIRQVADAQFGGSGPAAEHLWDKRNEEAARFFERFGGKR